MEEVDLAAMGEEEKEVCHLVQCVSDAEQLATTHLDALKLTMVEKEDMQVAHMLSL